MAAVTMRIAAAVTIALSRCQYGQLRLIIITWIALANDGRRHLTRDHADKEDGRFVNAIGQQSLHSLTHFPSSRAGGYHEKHSVALKVWREAHNAPWFGLRSIERVRRSRLGGDTERHVTCR